MHTPLLKYPGGKRRLAPLLPAAPVTTWIEPFVGAGAVALQRAGHAKRIIAADASPFAQDWWHALRYATVDGVLCAYAALPRDRVKVAAAYAVQRERYRNTQHVMRTPDELVALIFWLNHAGFNGLVRFNRKGVYNVPCGKGASPLPEIEEASLRRHMKIAKKMAVFFDYRRALAEPCPPEDLPTVAFVDPPYLGGFTGYAPTAWDAADLAELLDRLGAWKRDLPERKVWLCEHQGGLAEEMIRAAGFKLLLGWGRSKRITCDYKDRGGSVAEGVWSF